MAWVTLLTDISVGIHINTFLRKRKFDSKETEGWYRCASKVVELSTINTTFIFTRNWMATFMF